MFNTPPIKRHDHLIETDSTDLEPLMNVVVETVEDEDMEEEYGNLEANDEYVG